MRIDKIYLKNFRCYEELEVDFHSGVNLLVGVNGSGKTSLLEALCISSGSYFLQIPIVKHYPIENDQARLSYVERKFIRNFPVIIRSLDKQHDTEWQRAKNSLNGKTTTKETYFVSNQGWSNYNALTKEVSKVVSIDLPIISYYSTQRLFKSKSITKNKLKLGRFDGYFNCLDDENTIKHFIEWWEAAENDELKEKEINPEFEDVTLRVVRNVILEVLKSEFGENVSPRAAYYSKNLDELVILKKDSRIPYSHLSDGFKNIIGLFADLAYRASVLNPHFGLDATKLAHGVVMIDEIDLHLHPSWQGKVMSILVSVFPKIQFFITTHSPIVASSFSLRRDEEGQQDIDGIFGLSNFQINPIATHFYGADANTTIDNLLHGPVRASEPQALIDRFDELSRSEHVDVNAIREVVGKLESILSSTDPEMIRISTIWELFK